MRSPMLVGAAQAGFVTAAVLSGIERRAPAGVETNHRLPLQHPGPLHPLIHLNRSEPVAD